MFARTVAGVGLDFRSPVDTHCVCECRTAVDGGMQVSLLVIGSDQVTRGFQKGMAAFGRISWCSEGVTG